MPGSPLSPARRLAIIALARISGPGKAAKAAHVDVRTVTRWLEEEGDANHDEQEWAGARAAAQELHLTALLNGDTRGLAAWATSAGVSSRNQRYARLIARREAKRDTEQDAGDTIEARRQAIIAKLEPWQPETPASHRRDRYVYECRERLAAFIDRADDPEAAEVWRDTPDPGPEHAAGIRYLNLRLNLGAQPDLSDVDWEASFGALLAEVHAAADAWWPGHCSVLQAKAYIDRDANGRIRIRPDGERITIELPPGSPLPAEYEGATVFAVSLPSAAQDVSPRPQLPYQPPEPVQEAPRPDDHDHPSWRRLQ